ncbi:MAG: glycosyltransferase family 2 protein [Clostridia bacterium]|nr:glycosyltransferase family 2 protein [Clostridia bacterium]
MKISFLVTYYQQVRFVRESMESLLALEKPAEWEILIGDDGSTDGTIEAVQAYVAQDPEHIHLFVMPRDPAQKYNSVERASLNRLNLVRHAKGEYYCLMDGDDFYSETDFLPQALAVLEAQPEVHVVAFDTWMYREGQARRAKQPDRAAPVPTHRKTYLRWQYTHAGACVFRNAHTPENLQKLAQLGLFDDNDITLNGLNGGKLVRIPRPVYAYRQAEGSVYTAMQPEERAALNLAGLGACLRIMDDRWEREVLARFATAVWMGWFLRKGLRQRMDPGKYRTYLAACGRAGFRQGEKLLRYPELEKAERREVRKWVFRAGWLSPPRIAFAWLQIHRGGKNRE